MYTYDFFKFGGAPTDFVSAAGPSLLLDVYEDLSTAENDVVFRLRNTLDNDYDSSTIVNIAFDTGTMGSALFTAVSISGQSPGVSLQMPGNSDSLLGGDNIRFTKDYTIGFSDSTATGSDGVNLNEWLSVRALLAPLYDFADVISALGTGMASTYTDALDTAHMTDEEKSEYNAGAVQGLRVSLLLWSVVPNSVESAGHGLFVTHGLINTTGSPGTNPDDQTLTGDIEDNILDGGTGADTMSGGLGDDIYIVDDLDDQVIELAGEGTDTVRTTVSFALPAHVEKLVLMGPGVANGAGVISGAGNESDNIIFATDGDNYMDGKGGRDTLSYGNSTAGVTVSLGPTSGQITGGSGKDTVLNFENLVGSNFNDKLSGNRDANVIDGGTGADIMAGNDGNDTYIVDDAGDIVTDSRGTDTVRAWITWTLGTGLENLQLLGSSAIDGSGNGSNNVLTGNGANNTLRGLGGNDTLDGGGGIDTLFGGTGTDTYIIDTDTDVIIENASEGTDSVSSSVTYTLGSNVENLTLTGTATINATGNALSNVVTGNGANNYLVGLGGNDTLDGGAGADIMEGGMGNDTYVVDDASDVIIELASQGTDTVKSSISYTVEPASNLENITLAGSAVINATGNQVNNVLTGNGANNHLIGLAGNDTLDGGGGADTMDGGLGNDTYVVDNNFDVIVEAAAQGTDTVKSAISYVLGADSNLENLTLTGSAAINATGNQVSNTLTGNSGSNVLDGGAGNDVLVGGKGADTLIGGAGVDRFDFNYLTDSPIGAGRDVISDFSSADGDKIDLSTLDANTGVSGNQAFTFIGDAAFSAAGQIRFADGVLQGNVNGDVVADFEIGLIGVTSLTASDFIA
jgi:Ca2+-binding RTX toxin-like protein